MTSLQRRRALACTILALASLVSGAANSQTSWPTKPVRIVLPYTPGGSADVVARLLAQKLSISFGQRFIVENKPGASGNIGAEQVVRAAPDGYTLLVIADSIATINPYVYPGMRFNPAKDLLPVSLLTTIGVGLIVNPSIPANTVTEYVALAKSQRAGLSFGSPGAGTPHHLAGELLTQFSGANLVHIPYKGGGQAMIDVLSNQLPSAFVALAIAAPQIHAGKLKLLAVTDALRSSLFPATPTIGETFHGYEVTSWLGLFAPAGTPADVVQKLNAEVRKTLLDPSTAQQLAALSLNVVAGSAADLGARIQTDYERWGRLIKANNITFAH